MVLREKIELCFRSERDPAEAAILVMGMLEMFGPELAPGWIETDDLLMGDDRKGVLFDYARKRAAALLVGHFEAAAKRGS